MMNVLKSDPKPKSVAKLQSDMPTRRFNAINEITARRNGLKPPYPERFAQIAAHDTDFLVKATALRALNRARDASATPYFIAALNDPVAKVRLEGAKALVNLPDEKAVPGLLSLLNNPNEDKDVRIAAAEALRSYRSLPVARALAAQLNDREFGIAWQSLRSLRRMLNKDLRYSETDWLDFFLGPDKPFG